ncbi:putative mannose-6-phosphate isomerase ManA [Spirochaetia bacterium]|nr:putative mannose-6-phosphate isomerase ManA [Spirochaetia bacterium]
MKIFRLDNKIKHYAWGSPDWIPSLTGKQNPGAEPWAELWMGIHGEGPSELETTGGRITLDALIAGNPPEYLGAETAREFGNLPFLLKFLAAAMPLSIQAHPNLEQAREGFERENRAGLSPSDPRRNYKDPNHKPEIISAITPFTAMAGFRNIAETRALLETFFADSTGMEIQDKLLRALEGGFRPFLTALFGLDAAERRILTKTAVTWGEDVNNADAPQKALALCGRFAAIYPDDPGILAPLYLNVIELEPGQAIAIPSGMLHAYVYGFGVECMANSDNVLRGGLTPKHIDLEELLRILSFDPYLPEILKGIPCGEAAASPGTGGWTRYSTPFREFTLYRREPQFPLKPESAGGLFPLKDPGAAIVAITRGEAALGAGDAELILKQGEAAFVPRRNEGAVLTVQGDCGAFAALANT